MEHIKGGHLSLSDAVYNQLLMRISEGEWKDGDKIPSEHQLCKIFQVSRVSIRAAIQKLQGQGLLVTKQGIGSFVHIPKRRSSEDVIRQSSDITNKAFLEFFEFRQAIEFKAIDLFAIRATEEDMQALQNALSRMKAQIEEDKAYADADFDFHMAIILGAGNSYFVQVIEAYEKTFYHYIAEIDRLSTAEEREMAVKGHEMICKLLRDKKPNDAKVWLFEDNIYHHLTMFQNQNGREG